MTYAEMQTEYEKIDKEKWELLEALKLEHDKSDDLHTFNPEDCPVCKLIRKIEE